MKEYSVLASLLWCCIIFGSGIEAKHKKPHLIIIVADDLGWNDVGFHGSKEIPTPNIDQLANDGIILNNYYTQPTCTPSRAALLTGKYPIHTGMQGMVIEPDQTWGLGLNETLLPQYLKKEGYMTHQVGKWHLGHFAKEYTPTYRGFDTFFGNYLGWNDYWNYHNNEVEGQDALDMRDMEEPFPGKGEYSTEVLTKQGEDRINKHNPSTPMFLYMAYTAPHTATSDDPNQAPQEWIDKYSHIKHEERRKYAAMVGYLDHGIGRIRDALAKKGMLDDAVIVFKADNGGAPADFHHGQASNHPLRGTKASLYEGAIRVAAFVYSKKLKHAGTVSNELMHVSDWMPTFLKLAGGRIPKNLDGHDMWAHLQKREPNPRKEILLNIDETDLQNAGLRVGDWKLMKQGGGLGMMWDGWYPPPNYNPDDYSPGTTAQVKCKKPPKFHRKCLSYCLFNLKKDPCEYNNVAKDFPDTFNEMKEKLEGYKKGMVPSRHNDTSDPMSNPNLHGGVWGPWVILQK